MKRGFDSQIYIRVQTEEILKRVSKFKRLYLEFGGKLCYDNHASRVLPGYKKTTKIDILKKLDSLRIVYCINAKDLQSNKVLGKDERTYQEQAMRDFRDIKKFKLSNDVVVITRFENEPKAKEFAEKVRTLGKKVYFHKEIENYSNPSSAIRGYDSQPYIPIKENLIIITGPAGDSGKMAVGLSQLYHEKKRKRKSGYAKFETFPIWNLPINHPINLAYEAATADIQDVVMIDPFYKKAYGGNAVNYNRDINNFSILQAIAKKITKTKFPYGYKSPTDMGVNMAKSGIIDDKICRIASIKEIRRRYKYYKKEYRNGEADGKTMRRIKEILSKIK